MCPSLRRPCSPENSASQSQNISTVSAASQPCCLILLFVTGPVCLVSWFSSLVPVSRASIDLTPWWTKRWSATYVMRGNGV